MSNDEHNQKIKNDRPEQLKLIEELIKGTSYKNAAAIEAIYMVVILGFDKLQSTMQILAEMAQHENNGATVKTITNYSRQLFMEEMVICDKTTNRYQLTSIKLIKQRLNKQNVRKKWNDLQTGLRKIPGKKHSVIKWSTAMRYLTDYSEIIHWYMGYSFLIKAFSSKIESERIQMM